MRGKRGKEEKKKAGHGSRGFRCTEGKDQRIKVRSNMKLIYSVCFVIISIYMLFQVSPTDVACCHERC